jgi:hypothetical protein
MKNKTENNIAEEFDQYIGKNYPEVAYHLAEASISQAKLLGYQFKTTPTEMNKKREKILKKMARFASFARNAYSKL